MTYLLFEENKIKKKAYDKSNQILCTIKEKSYSFHFYAHFDGIQNTYKS